MAVAQVGSGEGRCKQCGYPRGGLGRQFYVPVERRSYGAGFELIRVKSGTQCVRHDRLAKVIVFNGLHHRRADAEAMLLLGQPHRELRTQALVTFYAGGDHDVQRQCGTKLFDPAQERRNVHANQCEDLSFRTTIDTMRG